MIFLFKALMAPTSEHLPKLKRWHPSDAKLTWRFKRSQAPGQAPPEDLLRGGGDGGKWVVHGFKQELKCAEFITKDANPGRGCGRKKRHLQRNPHAVNVRC
jgi:hypothetical protein